MAAQDGLHRLASQLWMIVLLAEVTEPDVAQMFRHVLCKCFATVFIRQMPALAGNALLQIRRIRTALQHLQIVVGLDHQIIGIGNSLIALLGDTAGIGDNHETDISYPDLIAHILTGIMGNGEWLDDEITQIQLQSWHNGHLQIWCHLPRDAVVRFDTHVHELGGIDGYLVVMTEGAHRLDVVSMIVSDQHMIHLIQVYAVVPALLLQCTDTHTYIYDECVSCGGKIVTVSTAPASERYKLQHPIL